MTGLEQDRKTIRETLLAAGWAVSDRGKFSDERAFMEHDNDKLFLEVWEGENEEKDRYFKLVLSPDFGQGIYLSVHFHDDAAKLTEALKTIVGFQDSIAPDNFKVHVRRLLKVIPDILLDTEDDLIPLVDDETLGMPTEMAAKSG